MISTKSVQEGVSKYPQRLDPGVHKVKIANITSGESARNKTPFIEFLFENAYGYHRETFYMKEGESMRISLEKIKHIATKIESEETVDKVTGKTVAEYAANLGTLLINKEVRIKLCGKEQMNTNTKKVFVERYFNFYPFAESVTTPDNATMLKYSATNKGDYKALASSTNAVSDPMDLSTAGMTAQDDDLPF